MSILLREIVSQAINSIRVILVEYSSIRRKEESGRLRGVSKRVLRQTGSPMLDSSANADRTTDRTPQRLNAAGATRDEDGCSSCAPLADFAPTIVAHITQFALPA